MGLDKTSKNWNLYESAVSVKNVDNPGIYCYSGAVKSIHDSSELMLP